MKQDNKDKKKIKTAAKEELADYLYHKCKIEGPKIDSVMMWVKDMKEKEKIILPEGSYTNSIVPVSVPSEHQVFAVIDRQGKHKIIKLISDKTAAHTEQAGNYHLSREGFNFIAGSDESRPSKGADFYVTSQDFKDARGGTSLGKKARALNKLHTTGLNVLKEKCVDIPMKEYLEFEQLFEEIKSYSKSRGILVRTGDIRRIKSIYDDSVAYFIENKCSSLIHNDTKADNWGGNFLFDLTDMAIGPEAFDLAIAVYDPKTYTPKRTDILKRIYASESGKDISESVERAKTIQAVQSIATNLKFMSERPSHYNSSREKVEFLQHIILNN